MNRHGCEIENHNRIIQLPIIKVENIDYLDCELFEISSV